MKLAGIITAAVMAALLAGCSGGEDPALKGLPSNPVSGADQVGVKLKQTFANDAELQTPIDEVTKALKAHDLEGAAVGVMVIQRQGAATRTYEQTLVLNQLMANLQGNISSGVANGDPAAIKAAEALRASSMRGR